jgi:sorbitol-6-phosphate 2-dehydrogenase
MSKVALVVGGGQTLGEFISRGLADDGYRVIVADLNEKNAISVSKEISQEYGDETAFGIGVDATNESSVKEMVERVDSLVGRLATINQC